MYDGFGEGVSLSGDRLVVGAPGDDDMGDAAGAAYLFTRQDGGWVEQAKLLASDGEAHDFFGTEVAISDGTIVVGADHDDDAGPDSGSAYIYEMETPYPVDISISSINLRSRGRTPVAVLTTEEFDAATIDPATVRFAGAAPVHYALEDMDGDGDEDLILHFMTQDLNIDPSASDAMLIGQTYEGQLVVGMDSIKIVPSK
jgi:hypothetical protein